MSERRQLRREVVVGLVIAVLAGVILLGLEYRSGLFIERDTVARPTVIVQDTLTPSSSDREPVSIGNDESTTLNFGGELITISVLQPAGPLLRGTPLIEKVEVNIETSYEHATETILKGGCVFIRPFTVTYNRSRIKLSFPDLLDEYHEFLVVSRAADFNLDSCTNPEE